LNLFKILTQKFLTQKWLGNNTQPLLSTKTKHRGRAFVLTLWDDAMLKTLKESNPEYLVYAPEICPSSGKKHYQCYVYYKSPRYLDAMWKKFPMAYCKPAAGSAEENKSYIKGPYTNKEGKSKPFNPDAVEMGTIPNQGKRNDLEAFAEAITEGKRGRELTHEHLAIRAKYPRLEQILVQEDDEEKCIEQFKAGMRPEVHVRWGKAGTGKSRYIYDNYDAMDVYALNIGDGSAKSVWWDGYRGQKVILIEDFAGGEMPWKYLLRLLDRYPFRMQVKGSYCYRRCEKIYITANDKPEHWYPHEAFEPLQRRIDSVTHVEENHTPYGPLGSASASAPASPARS